MSWGEVTSNKATEKQIKYAEVLLEAYYGDICEPIYKMNVSEISALIDDIKKKCEAKGINYHSSTTEVQHGTEVEGRPQLHRTERDNPILGREPVQGCPEPNYEINADTILNLQRQAREYMNTRTRELRVERERQAERARQVAMQSEHWFTQAMQREQAPRTTRARNPLYGVGEVGSLQQQVINPVQSPPSNEHLQNAWEPITIPTTRLSPEEIRRMCVTQTAPDNNGGVDILVRCGNLAYSEHINREQTFSSVDVVSRIIEDLTNRIVYEMTTTRIMDAEL